MKRTTKQRSAILSTIKKTGAPLSVEEIFNSVLPEIPKINLSTIYRNLKTLIEEKAVKAVEIPGELPRYEMVQEKHFHHFFCEMCERLFNISFCPDNILAMVPSGFKMTSHSITLRGHCSSCLER